MTTATKLQLPCDFLPSPQVQREIQSYSFELKPVHELGSASVEDWVSAAFRILLSRYNGQTNEFIEKTPRDYLNQPRLFQADELFEYSVIQEKDSRKKDRKLTGKEIGLQLIPGKDCFRARIHYNSSLFKLNTIERLSQHLQMILAGMPDYLDSPISELQLLTESELRWIEENCNGVEKSTSINWVHEQIEHHARNTPHAIALRFRDQTLSYHDLNVRSNQLARLLQSKGLGRESRIFVCVEPSFDIMIALMGILKAGAVYVPLDPGYPQARIRVIADDTQPSLLITQKHLVERLSLPELPTVVIEGTIEESKFSKENLNLTIDPNQTAYIYFTSGTTGLPKGSLASYANLLSYIQVAHDRYGLTPREISPSIARFTFSISMFELMLPLFSGGTLLLLDREHILDLARFTKTLSDVSFFHAGPALLKSVIAYIKKNYSSFEPFSRVRHASSGGDLIAPEILEDLKGIFSNAEIFVIYGCSEISCMGTTYLVPAASPVTKTYVGRPFENMAIRVLDAHQKWVPAGITGEIYFSGGGIVKGYLNRETLSEEKFIELEGRRFYRTGDTGKLSEDGFLEVLGRSDFQLKLRGMRVELGEIEYHLRKSTPVRDALVAAKDMGLDEKSLVAYFVRQPDASGEVIAEIRHHMQLNLPDYMVPSIYVELPALPLNVNMKVDRNALPDPAQADRRISPQSLIRAPETSTERALAEIWKGLLHLDQVGLDDHFFDLGGHSLLALELIVAVNEKLGIALEGMEVLREPLGIQARICDQRLGKVSVQATFIQDIKLQQSTHFFHFGPDQSLYGMLHEVPSATSREAVLICSPVGQEQVRTHFILQRLANQLSDLGIPTLRFDYYGCGDSLGLGKDGHCLRWKKDIVSAYEELKRRTGATNVTLVGTRLGGTLAHAAVKDSLESHHKTRLILWDPVLDGNDYLIELAHTHRSHLKEIRNRRLRKSPARIQNGKEYLGSVYSNKNLKELAEVQILQSLGNMREKIPTHILTTSLRDFETLGTLDSITQKKFLSFNSGWNDSNLLGQILPDTGITKILLSWITEKGEAP